MHRTPLSETVRATLARRPGLLPRVLTGGDDYELLFAVSADDVDHVGELAVALNVRLTAIGRLVEGEGVTVRGPDGAPMSLEEAGFRHF